MSETPEEFERWRARRQAELTSPESWLGLVGLFWLEPGLNRVGSADDAIVRLPGGPACLGDLHVDGGRVTWRPVSGRCCGLQTDAAGEPSAVDHQNWSFFFVFRDATSGRETYGAGRFLKAPVAVDGRIALDFNFACNPPCTFTAFATCPLPPPENWLPFAVPAGEKKWPGG